MVDRVVPTGTALAAAVELGRELDQLPQVAMRHDRLSLIEQWGLDEDDAARQEAVKGRAVIASGETLAGAARFAGGAGRGGAPA